MKIIFPRQGFVGRIRQCCQFVISSMILITTVPQQALGQTLDQQYDFYLQSKCENLGFARDNNSIILPGQAGPNLFAYCNGPEPTSDLPPGATASVNANGGGAGTAAGRGNGIGAATDRRQTQLRDEDDGDPLSEALDISLLSTEKLGLFVSLDMLRERREQTTFEAGVKSRHTSVTTGADYRFGPALVMGLAFNLSNQTGDFDSGGNFEKDSCGLILYGSWFPSDDLFIDLNISQESAKHDTQRIVGRRQVTTTQTGSTVTFDIPLSPVEGHSDSRTQSVNVRGGYDYLFRDIVIGPRLGLAQRRSVLDGYGEIGATPMSLRFKQQTETSLQSSLGVQANKAFSLSTGVVSLQMNLSWLHEFKDDQRNITAQFTEDLRADAVQFTFLNQPPDRDWFTFQVASVAVFSDGLSAFISFESNLGHDYIDQYGVGIGLRKAL